MTWSARVGLGLWLFALVAAAAPGTAAAQQGVAPENVITVPVGNSVIITHPTALERIMVTNPDVADPVAVTLREVVINGLQSGTTTLIFWDATGARHMYSIRVSADVGSIQHELDRAMPGSGITVSAVGNSVILGGESNDHRTVERAMQLAGAMVGEAAVVNQISMPDPGQIMLRVRIAEVSRTAIQRLGINFLYQGPDVEGFVYSGGVSSFSGAFPAPPSHTFSDAVNFYLFHQSSNLATFIQALRDQGVFRSLAEPNLVTVPGVTASFLAGGEFPYPMVQPQTGQVTVQFREFGILLNFTPTVTNSGAIRLDVAPEVSSLDFANGVQVAGSLVPALISRKAETTVELYAGQTFAIAGLIDREMTETGTSVPILGDIPILGAFFRSKQMRESETEVLVLVTPEFVRPEDQMPEIPTGEVDTWPWTDFMTRPLRVVPPAEPVGDGEVGQGG